LVCCGDLGHPRKNVALALAATRILAGRGRTLELELIGANADALAPHLRGMPSSVSVTCSGRVAAAAVHVRMRAADVLLLPSRFEEWGYVAVEAALHGTSTATLPVYPFMEMLAPPLGVCAAGATPEQYADAVAEALDDPAPRDAVRVRAEERFGLANAGRALSAVWSEPDAASGAVPTAPLSRRELIQPTTDGRMSR
jgi:glycosyltransferase involved in cell wall biosynthesis